MIRVNLLYPRTESHQAWKALLLRQGRSAIVSRRELLLAVILLAAGGAMLHIYLGVFRTGAAGNDVTREAQTARPAPRTPIDSTPQDDRNVVTEQAAEEERVRPPTAPQDRSNPPAEVIEDAKAQDAAPTPPQPPPAKRAPRSPPDAAKLSKVHISTGTGSLKMSLDIGSRPTYNSFRLKEPNRVVVDVPGVRVMLPKEQLHHKVEHPLVNRIRIGQFKSDPPIARVVLDVTGFPNLLLFPHSGGLDIHVANTTQ